MSEMAVFSDIMQVIELTQLQDIQHVSERLKNAGNQELLDFHGFSAETMQYCGDNYSVTIIFIYLRNNYIRYEDRYYWQGT